MVVLKQKWIFISLFDIFIFVLSLIKPETTIMTLVLVVWSNCVIFAIEDLDKRGALFAFLVSFFLLLIGREALEVFGMHEVEDEFSDKLNRQAEWMVLLSLLMFSFGYITFRKITFNTRRKADPDYNSLQYVVVRQISAIFFYLSFAFNIFTLLDIVSFVLRHGYILYYTSYASSVPYIIKKVGDMCLVCYWIFLATMPPKRSVNKLSMFYIIYLLLTLGTGKRFPFVAGILTVFVYYIARNKVNSGGQIWITRKTIIVMLCISAPILIMALYVIGQVRVNNVVESLRIDKIISQFFYKQGVSINVIKRAQVYKDNLPQGKYYLFGSTFETIANNAISRLLGADQYSGNTVEHAVNGYSFQHALSYASMGSYYLSGHGLGSCYIAEAYHDSGYLGIILVNFIYGILLRKLFDFRRHGIWGCAVILSMLYSFLLAPRGSADGFIADTVDLTVWGTILIVWFISKLLLRRLNPAEYNH